MKPNCFDPLLPSLPGIIRQHRPAPGEAATKYTDAELYRIVVAQALTNGTASTKAEFDAIVRTLGNVGGADELIAFRNIRQSCKAWRYGTHMVCECGRSWRVDDASPPTCRSMPNG